MPNDIKKWETTRKKGKAKFILTNGVLSWGLPMFFVMTFVVNRPAHGATPPSMVMISAVIWALGGALFGTVIWTMSEKKYLKFLEARKSPPPLPG